MRPVKTQSGKGKRPTIRDVASRAGVSHQTVSRVINSHGYVHKETRERVLNAIKDLDFVPNGVARSLTANRTQTIGVLTTDISDHFFADFFAGAEAESPRTTFYLLTLTSPAQGLSPRPANTSNPLHQITRTARPRLGPRERRSRDGEPSRGGRSIHCPFRSIRLLGAGGRYRNAPAWAPGPG